MSTIYKEVSELVISRLKKERKNWKQNCPKGFYANPLQYSDGSVNMLKWQCLIPGPEKTPWEGGSYPLYLDFSHGYPVRPPRCHFSPVIPHPNVYPSGRICLSILDEEEDWKPYLTIKSILEGIYMLLKEEPNIQSPAQKEPLALYRFNRKKYMEMVRQYANQNKENKPNQPTIDNI